MNFIFDWDLKYKQGILKCENIALIREAFSVVNKASFFRKNRFIPTRKYVISQQGRFDIGLFGEIYKYIKSLNIDFNVVTTNDFINKFFVPYKNNIKYMPTLNLVLRDYQLKSCQEALNKGRGIIVLPTASGKTLVMASLVNIIRKNNLSKQTLIIVPSIQLVEQTYNDFISYGISPDEISKWSGNNSLIVKPIIVAGISILQSKKQDLSILKQVDLFVVDECLRYNTVIKTFNGNKFIQDINIGDMVLSKNIEKNIIEYKKVLKIYRNIQKSNSYDYFLEIILKNDKKIYVTPNHKIYTKNRGYIRADELDKNDNIEIYE